MKIREIKDKVNNKSCVYRQKIIAPTNTRMSDWQKQVVCRYFVLGSCKKGEGCAYSHDPDLIPQSTGFAQVNMDEFTGIHMFKYLLDEV